MKRFSMNMTLAVAALAVAAGTASAQTMKAEIPFAFRAGNQVMQPGEYRVRLIMNSSTPVLMLADFDSGRSVLLMANRNEVPKEWTAAGVARLTFTCDEGPCAITRIWMGAGYTFNFPAARGKNGEPHIAEIVLRTARAD